MIKPTLLFLHLFISAIIGYFVSDSNHAHAFSKRGFVIIDPLPLRVDNLVLRKPILELRSIFFDVRIHAAIAEGTFTLALCEVRARHLTKRPLILLNEVIFVATDTMEV